MAKDRYSDDHTIEIVGDTNTLNINDNLNVSGNLDIGGMVTGSISTDSITSSGDLVITADSITLDSDTIVFTSTPERNVTEARYMSYHASAFTWAYPDVFVGTGPTLNIADAMSWSINEHNNYSVFACPINNIPNGSIITELKIYYTPGHVDDDIGVSLWSVNLTDGSDTQLGDENLTISPNVYTAESVALSSIPQVEYQNNTYFIKFSAKKGSAGTDLAFYGARILYQTKSVGL